MTMHMHNDAYRCLSDPGRPHAPPHRGGAPRRRAGGERYRRHRRHRPVGGLAPSRHPAQGGLRAGSPGWAQAALFTAAGALPRARCLGRRLPKPLGGAPRRVRRGARPQAEVPHGKTPGDRDMANKTTNETSPAASKRRITLERTYDARIEDVWELWTTKDGNESWWGPGGFSVQVRKLELRPGGELHYAMTAVAPPQIEFMQKAGMPLTTEARLTYTEIVAPRRLAYTHLADFIPGVAPY